MSPKYTCVEADGEVDIRMDKEGPGSWAPKTVMQVLQDTVKKHGNRPALRYKKIPQGASSASVEWTTVTWNDYYQKIQAFGKSLLSINFGAHRAINIIGFNSAEWLIANCGAIAAGGVAVGIYTSSVPEACQYITEHSEAEVVVVENKKQLDKFTAISHKLPNLKALVMWDGTQEEVNATAPSAACPIYTWDSFIKLGANIPDADLKARMDAQRPGHACTLIYTSGTTGPPKAVMISHDNLTWTVDAFVHNLKMTMDENERCVSYLPLSHVAAQMLDIHMPMSRGSCVYFAQPDALRGSLPATLKEALPTYFMGVPRVWEKIYEKMQAVARETKGIKKKLSTWAKSKGAEKNRRHQFGAEGGAPSGYGCAHALVLKKISAALGLNHAKICITSAAPISVEILDYFASIDIPVLELFGMSECTGPHSSNFPYAWKIGSIGREMMGVKTKSLASNGEFCFYGRHVMMGYMKMADKTAEAIDADGWLHSGDVATVDKDGFWTITGRIKELLITAGGENVPPVLIESEFKKELPALSNAMAIGDKQKFLTMLFCLKTVIGEDGVPTSTLASEALGIGQSLGSNAKTVEEVMNDALWKKYLDDGLKRANSRAASEAQRIQKYAILPLDFTEKGGELTPTLKLKRSEVIKKYSNIIDSFYQEGVAKPAAMA